jgi:hypothetical protein
MGAEPLFPSHRVPAVWWGTKPCQHGRGPLTCSCHSGGLLAARLQLRGSRVLLGLGVVVEQGGLVTSWRSYPRSVWNHVFGLHAPESQQICSVSSTTCLCIQAWGSWDSPNLF